MIRKLNVTLGVICLICALALVGVIIYTKVSSVDKSKLAQQIENQIVGDNF